MAENSKISWTHHTFNPWEGCQNVGPGCDHCYAENRNARFGGGTAVNWGPGAPRRRTSAANWAKPVKWNAQAERLGIRYRVFCASLADVFDNAVPGLWRQHLMTLVADTPHLDWLFLTKRIGNARRMLSDASMHDGRLLDADDQYLPPLNLWIGATVVNQEEADRDIHKLLALPAAKRFLSMEPLLGPVNLTDIRMPESGHGHHEFSPIITGNCLARPRGKPAVNWVIVGGESGPKARPMHPEWVRSLRDQCQRAGVPFHFKQWGEWAPRSSCHHTLTNGQAAADIDPGATRWPCVRLTESGKNGLDLANTGVGYDVYLQKVGVELSGRMLDGRIWDECPGAKERP